MTNTRTTLDTVLMTSSLDIYVGPNPETTYSFSSPDVTLTARSNVASLTKENFHDNIQNISEWNLLLDTNFPNPNDFAHPFLDKIRKTSNQIKVDFELSRVVVTDAAWNKNTGLFTFQPRTQIVMNRTEFKMWRNFLVRFYSEALRFD